MKQFIVIQGPTKYYNEIKNCYNKNTIISTWRNEPYESVIFLSKHFPLICSKYPESSGYYNINLQCRSTYEGLLLAKAYGSTHVLKIRSDIIIPEIDRFLEVLSKKEKLSFLAWHFFGYATDYIVYGSIDEMLNYWNLYTNEQTNGETNLLNNYNKIKNIKINSFDESKKYFDYFLDDMIKENIHIYWLSRNNLDLSSYADEKQAYSY